MMTLKLFLKPFVIDCEEVREEVPDHMKEMGVLHISLTPKAIALLSALNAGMIPEVEEGYDDAQFQAFWNNFEARLTEQGLKIVKDPGPMLNQQRKQRAEEYIKYLKLVLCAFFGSLLTSLLSYLFSLL